LPDPRLVDVIARAHLYLAKLTEGANQSVADVATLFGVHSADVSRILPLAFLSPKIVGKILNGTQPADLTIRKLARVPFHRPATIRPRAGKTGAGEKFESAVRPADSSIPLGSAQMERR
jgi:hypothetical protein